MLSGRMGTIYDLRSRALVAADEESAIERAR